MATHCSDFISAPPALINLGPFIVKLPLQRLDKLLPGAQWQSRHLRILPVQSAVGEEERVP